MIELRNLTKRFGELTAVNDVTLTVNRGEFFAVLGPNAAGKTTTIKMITGLIKPTSGTVRVAGHDVQAEPLEVRRRLAYVPDFPFLYDKLTPWEFFRFIGQLFKMADDRIEAASRALIPRFNLEEYLRKPIEGLSHGTRQRVAIPKREGVVLRFVADHDLKMGRFLCKQHVNAVDPELPGLLHGPLLEHPAHGRLVLQVHSLPDRLRNLPVGLDHKVFPETPPDLREAAAGFGLGGLREERRSVANRSVLRLRDRRA